MVHVMVHVMVQVMVQVVQVGACDGAGAGGWM